MLYLSCNLNMIYMTLLGAQFFYFYMELFDAIISVSFFHVIWSTFLECVKVPMPAHQILPLTAYIFEASYSTSATQANKI